MYNGGITATFTATRVFLGKLRYTNTPHMTTSINVIIDKRKQLSSGEYPLKLNVNLHGVQYRIATKLTTLESVYDKYKANTRHTAESRACVIKSTLN